MEHQADLIAIAHDIRLKQRRPIDLNDRELVANNYSRFHGWMSGGSDEPTRRSSSRIHGLTDFYYGLGGPARQQSSWGVHGLGGGVRGRSRHRDRIIRPNAISRSKRRDTGARGSSISPTR